MLRAPVIPQSKGAGFPSYATAELGIDDKLVQVIEQGLTFFLRHVFETDGIGWVDPKRRTFGHRVHANDWVYLGIGFLVIVGDRHMFQMVFECRLGPIGSGGTMNSI